MGTLKEYQVGKNPIVSEEFDLTGVFSPVLLGSDTQTVCDVEELDEHVEGDRDVHS